MSISAPRDENHVPTILGTLNTDGITPVSIKVSPSTFGIKVDDNTTGSDHPATTAARDANRVPTIWGVSSADGVTPVSIYTDSSGNLLIDSN